MKNLIFGYRIPSMRDALRVQDRLLDFDIEVFIKTNHKVTWLFIDHDTHQNNEFINEWLQEKCTFSLVFNVYFIHISTIINEVLLIYDTNKILIGEIRVQNRKFSLPTDLIYNTCAIVNKLDNDNFTFIKNKFFQPKKQQYSLSEIYKTLLTVEKD